MSTTLDFDATAAAAEVDAAYSTPDVAATRIAVFRAANPKLGESVLDIGCGPGYLLRECALAVGGKGRVLGVDISEPMLAMTQQRCAGIVHVATEKADAGKIPSADGTFDLACALQIYAYVKELDEALAELCRALKPGGRAVILDTDFDGVVWQTTNRDRMQKILLPMKSTSRGLTFHVSCLAGCEGLDSRSNGAKGADADAQLSREHLRSRARPFIHRFVTQQAGIAVDEADAWMAEFDDLERAGSVLFAMNRFLFVGE